MYGIFYRPTELSLIKGFPKHLSIEYFQNNSWINCPGQWYMPRGNIGCVYLSMYPNPNSKISSLYKFFLKNPIVRKWVWKIAKCLFLYLTCQKGVSSGMTKVKMAKDTYPFADVNYLWHAMWKTVCYSDWANSIKTKLLTCNLQTIQSIKQTWLNLPYQNGKKCFTSDVKNSQHLQLDIFCHFNSCHSRINALKLESTFT